MLLNIIASIEGRKYTLKRMFHEDLKLTYHIHHEIITGLLVFRMLETKGHWMIMKQDMPRYVLGAEKALEEVINVNEKRLGRPVYRPLINWTVFQR